MGDGDLSLCVCVCVCVCPRARTSGHVRPAGSAAPLHLVSAIASRAAAAAATATNEVVACQTVPPLCAVSRRRYNSLWH